MKVNKESGHCGISTTNASIKHVVLSLIPCETHRIFSEKEFQLQHSLDFFATMREDLNKPNKMWSINSIIPEEKRMHALAVRQMKPKNKDENLSLGEIRWALSASLKHEFLRTDHNYRAKQTSGNRVHVLSWKAVLCFSNSLEVLQTAHSNKFVLISNWKKDLIQNLQIVRTIFILF